MAVQKSAATLPVRKHKFNPTPAADGAITKFFDRKQEQVSNVWLLFAKHALHVLVTQISNSTLSNGRSFPGQVMKCKLCTTGQAATATPETEVSCSTTSIFSACLQFDSLSSVEQQAYNYHSSCITCCSR